MSIIINNYGNALRLNNDKLSKEILDNFGIKTIVSRNEDQLFIAMNHYGSCFTLMTKLRWEFDYSVHKKGEVYIICINNVDECIYGEDKQYINNLKNKLK